MNYYQEYNKYVKMNVEKVEAQGFKNGFKFDDYKKGETVYYFESTAPAIEPELKEGKVKKIVKAKNAEGKDCIRQIEVENGSNSIRSFHSHYQFANHIFKKVVEEVAEESPVVEAAEQGETLIVERAMSVKNPRVKELLDEGWVWVGKEWNAAKNMYLATLERV